jgi:pimeloyl-ACP methyl ester carboxylesterase
VIVPGISGSILAQSSDATEVWPNIDKMLVSTSDDYLDALSLDPSGDLVGSTIYAAGILRDVNFKLGTVDLFTDDIYGNIIIAFTRQGYQEGKDLFVVPYDWRLDVSRSLGALTTAMTKAIAMSSNGKISIVAHSMGGLLVKAYFASVPSAPFLDKLVFVGVPQLGAPYAFKILNYGDDLGIPIANKDEIKKIAQNMPSIYELLPSQKYISTLGSYVNDLGVEKGNSQLIDLANAFHGVVDDMSLTMPNFYSIIGCGKPTITGFTLRDGGAFDLLQGSGDGTVPMGSATNMTDPAHDYFVLSGRTGIDHTGLMSDARPVALITALIGGVTSSSIPEGISTSSLDCNLTSTPFTDETTIQLSAASKGNMIVL